MKKVTYKKAGVNIEKATAFKGLIKPLVRKSFRQEVLQDIGGFGSFFCLPKNKYIEPVMVSSTDGVGTKLKIASLANKHDKVGYDLVGMNVNDILCTGAEPLFFLDYIAAGKLEPQVLASVVKGITEACIESGCSLIGGETAEMPGMYKRGEYDLAGFCVGVVERKKIIDGSRIAAGNVVIGLESNGLHSNGYSLVRKVFSEKELVRMSDELLRPTRLYVKPVLSLLPQFDIKGIAHITGGAFYDKIARILPSTINVRINRGSWTIPPLFRLIQNKGGIEEREMFHTLNMGIGMVLMVEPGIAQSVIAKLAENKIRSWVIGDVVQGGKEVVIV